MKPQHNIDDIKDNIIRDTLRTLRDQRDDKQLLIRHGVYTLNPQIFNSGTHYVSEPIEFGSPYLRRPQIFFGEVVEKDVSSITSAELGISGYTPLVVHPYVYGYGQSSGVIDSFYLGIFLITSVPPSLSKLQINWYAIGKASAYAQHRIDEAWTSSYNKNEADHLVNETNQTDTQT